ncbi:MULTISPECIES: DNA recombination protein RmuC [unclassified Brenneria]|uniref:DNA recombination protein RmuC n=1 Tax=unclassified Brenneria TaxID=2634434 RepID=UPI001551844B|nr:DNA recombination protein RmuC [Brenneria sp. L3-3C-1]MEE3644673.1 DNA recombination protein RmuC [Brenneria sp. L3_3C_1]MEE3652235.1 DNA recombination protein RmuC [Brenneria sp. HEZEL_4_2_4]NPD02194.1 DNA recombination protein RmuC [Brenneria sp. hezel4-2-4]
MDISIFYGLGGGVIGLLAGWLIVGVSHQQRQSRHETDRRLLEQTLQQTQQLLNESQQARKQHEQQLRENELALRNVHGQLAASQEKLQQLAQLREECVQLNQELRALREVNSAQEAELREVTIRLEETRMAAEEKQRLLINSEQRLTTQFENLANRIFEHSGRKVDEQNKQSLDRLLMPLREQLDGFRRQVQDSFGAEARERHTLTHEIRNLQQLNAQMAREAINLTKALKGDNKTQGNWGEVVLSRVLEASGLREGYEYQTQVSVQTGANNRMQPDVIVRLPQGKDVVIDAKMSLVAYERYFNSEDDAERLAALNEHLLSVRGHIRLLGGKDYQQLPGLRSLDYVLMFIPVEPAFLVAIDRQPELIAEALKHNIMLVSPTTLLVALRTINNLWRYEQQSRNAQQIAERAARLYDKLRLFVDDMETLGQSLDRAHGSYRQAMNKLASGRGNLIGQAEGFRALGVEVKRPISPSLAEQATDHENAAGEALADTAGDGKPSAIDAEGR